MNSKSSIDHVIFFNDFYDILKLFKVVQIVKIFSIPTLFDLLITSFKLLKSGS